MSDEGDRIRSLMKLHDVSRQEAERMAADPREVIEHRRYVGKVESDHPVARQTISMIEREVQHFYDTQRAGHRVVSRSSRVDRQGFARVRWVIRPAMPFEGR